MTALFETQAMGLLGLSARPAVKAVPPCSVHSRPVKAAVKCGSREATFKRSTAVQSRPHSGLQHSPTLGSRRRQLTSAQGSTSGDESLDDLLPTLDLEATRLLQQKPSAPSPPQRAWSDPPSRPRVEGADSWQDPNPERPSWKTGTSAPARQAPPSEQTFNWSSPSQGRQPERRYQQSLRERQPPRDGYMTAFVPMEGWQPSDMEELSEDDPYGALKQDQWKVRRTLYHFLHTKYFGGEELTVGDMEFVVENALKFHPRAEEKMGGRARSIKVDAHPGFPNTKCFFVESERNQEWTDFSYLKCLEARFAAMKAKAKQLYPDANFDDLPSAPGVSPEGAARTGNGGRPGRSTWSTGEPSRRREPQGTYSQRQFVSRY